MASLSYDALQQELRRGESHPVYLLLGSEIYLRDEAAAKLKSAFVEPGAAGFDFAEFHAKSTSMAQIVEAVNTFPMISRLRVVFVTGMDSLPSAEHEPLLAYLENPARRGVLVLIATELDKRFVLAKRLMEHACVVEFPPLKDYALKTWANERIRREGCQISSGALDRLIALAGSDLMSLANEIDKLILFVGEAKRIPEAAIDDLVTSSRQSKLYELTGAIGRKDRREALRLMSNILESGEPPLVVLAAIARHFRQVLIAREVLDEGKDARTAALAAAADPRFADTLMRTARSVDPVGAREMCLRAAEADRRIKSTGLDEKLILESLIHSI